MLFAFLAPQKAYGDSITYDGETYEYTYDASKMYDGLNYSIANSGEVIIHDYYGSDKEVYIPSTIEGFPVTIIASGAFSQNKDITKVVIPENVKYIFYSAFQDCTNLKSISLPSTLKLLHWECFAGTTNLEEIIFNCEDVQIPYCG